MAASDDTKMDKRCPRQLQTLPDSWCHLAVLRLKAIRNAGRELTEAEEASSPGCPWAVNHGLAHYCFFTYLSKYASEKSLSDVEIAALLDVSMDTVKKTEKIALSKIRQAEAFADLIESHDGGIVSDMGNDN